MNNVPLHLWDAWVPQCVVGMEHFSRSALRQLSWEEPRALRHSWYLPASGKGREQTWPGRRQEVLRMNNCCQSYRMREAATFPVCPQPSQVAALSMGAWFPLDEPTPEVKGLAQGLAQGHSQDVKFPSPHSWHVPAGLSQSLWWHLPRVSLF